MRYVKRELILMPFHITMLNEYECTIEYSGSLVQFARIFNKIETWFGYDVDISTMFSPDKLHEVSQIRQASYHSLDVTNRDIKTPPLVVPDHSPEDPRPVNKMEQVTQQLVGRIMDHIDQQVKHLENIVLQQKTQNTPTLSRASMNTHPQSSGVPPQCQS